MGLGTVYLMFAQFATIISNYLIHVGLGRFLGPEQYGIFGVLMSLYLVNRAFLNTGIPTTVSKFIAESKKKIGGIINTSLKLQLIIASSFALIYILFSKQIALLLNDLSLTNYIIFLGIMVIPLSFVPLYNAFLNGLRLFGKQTILRIFYPSSRLAFTLGFVLLGLGVFGALLGHFVALIFSIMVGFLLLGRVKTTKESFSYKKILLFSLPVSIASLSFALIRNVNTLFLKSMLNDNFSLGLYTAAFTLSNITYLLFSALPQTLMPSISLSLSQNNFLLTQKYIRQSMRYLLLLLFPITLIIMATSKELLNLFYSSSYSAAGPVLAVLIVSSTFLAIFSTLCSVIIGSGKPKLYMIINLSFIAVLIALNLYLIPLYGLLGAAYSSLITSFLAAVFSSFYVWKKFKCLVNLTSFVRIFLVSLIVYFVSLKWHYSGVLLIISYMVIFSIYLILLYLFDEFKEDDFRLVSKVLQTFKH